MGSNKLFSALLVALFVCLAFSTVTLAQNEELVDEPFTPEPLPDVDMDIATTHVHADPEWSNVLTQRYYDAADFDNSVIVTDKPNPRLAAQFLASDPEAGAIIKDIMRSLEELNIQLDLATVLDSSSKSEKEWDGVLGLTGEESKEHRELRRRGGFGRIMKVVAKIAGKWLAIYI